MLKVCLRMVRNAGGYPAVYRAVYLWGSGNPGNPWVSRHFWIKWLPGPEMN